jgi:hypothetical protein
VKKPPVRQKKSSRNKVRRRYDARLEQGRKSCDAQAENEFICLVSRFSFLLRFSICLQIPVSSS